MGAPAHSLTTRDTSAYIAQARRSGLTYREIASQLGISRQRVHQIATRLALFPLCPRCATPLRGADARRGIHRTCLPLTPPADPPSCRRCGQPVTGTRRPASYCPRCRTVTRPCAWCGAPVTRDRVSQAAAFRNSQWFCTRSCFGRYIGHRYGFPRSRPPMSSPEPRPPRIRRTPGGHSLILPAHLAKMFLDTERVRVTVTPSSILLTRAPRHATGHGIRTLSRLTRAAHTRAVSLGRTPLAPWIRHGLVLHVARSTASSLTLAPTGPSTPEGRACGADPPAMLPPGYTITRTAGVAVLWRQTPAGPACVTVLADTTPDGQIAELAARDARSRGPRPSHPQEEIHARATREAHRPH
jgi:hypothetical protein